MHRGYQLIELMIVIAIVSALGAISYPLLSNHLSTAHRLACQKVLLELAAKLEEYQLNNNSYANVTLTLLGSNNVTPDQHYHLTLNTNEAHYLLTATPRHYDDCGRLSINQDGIKTSEANAVNCWN